jgi:hypothetical protein
MSFLRRPCLVLLLGCLGCAAGGRPCAAARHLNEALREKLEERAMRRLAEREVSSRLKEDCSGRICSLKLDLVSPSRPQAPRLDDSPIP